MGLSAAAAAGSLSVIIDLLEVEDEKVSKALSALRSQHEKHHLLTVTSCSSMYTPNHGSSVCMKPSLKKWSSRKKKTDSINEFLLLSRLVKTLVLVAVSRGSFWLYTSGVIITSLKMEVMKGRVLTSTKTRCHYSNQPHGKSI